jgi:hypothetical protein
VGVGAAANAGGANKRDGGPAHTADRAPQFRLNRTRRGIVLSQDDRTAVQQSTEGRAIGSLSEELARREGAKKQAAKDREQDVQSGVPGAK